MKHLGGAAVALAASALLATPATAQEGRRGNGVTTQELRGGTLIERGERRADRIDRRIDRNNDLRVNVQHKGKFGNGHGRFNAYGQSYRQVQKLKEQALYECACQLEEDAYRYGYRRAKLGRADVQQIGKRRFVVNGVARLNDGYRVRRQSYDCLVRKGSVRKVSDLYPARRFGHNRFYSHRPFKSITFSFGNDF